MRQTINECKRELLNEADALFQTHDKRKTSHEKRYTKNDWKRCTLYKRFFQTDVARCTHARYTINTRTKNGILDNRNVHPTV